MNAKRIFLAGLVLAGTHAAAQDVSVFRNVTVVPPDAERGLEAQTVVVRGERIETIGPAASARPAATKSHSLAARARGGACCGIRPAGGIGPASGLHAAGRRETMDGS